MIRERSFVDKLIACFPDENRDGIKFGKNFIRDITIQVTEDCNMACTYCYQHDKTCKAMSFETGKKFIDLILDSDERSANYIKSRECPGVILDFIGGEPFLEIDLIDKLTDYFIEQLIIRDHPWATRFRISICSNGLLYFNDKVQKYIRKNREHLSLSITLDGDKRIHDMCRLDKNGHPTYDRVKKAIDHYQEYWHGNIGTKVTISPDNIYYIGEAIIDMIKNGNKIINLNCVYEKGWEQKHGKILYDQLKMISEYILENDLEEDVFVSMLDLISGTSKNTDNTWCGGCGLMIAVDPNGDIYPCLRYTPSSIGNKREKFIIGNVDHGFLMTDEEIQRVKCFDCLTRKEQFAGTECETCPISDGCGDCIAYSYEVTGDVRKRTTYHCITHKARVLATSFYQNSRYRKQGSSERYPLNMSYEWAKEIVDDDELDMLTKIAASPNNSSVVLSGVYRLKLDMKVVNYLQRFDYLIKSYKDLFTFFFRKNSEFDSRFSEYHNEYLETYIEYELAKKEIYNRYFYNRLPQYDSLEVDLENNEMIIEVKSAYER